MLYKYKQEAYFVFFLSFFLGEYVLWHFTSSSRSGRQLCQTAEELLTLTRCDEAARADVFVFALGETASLTLSRLILGPGLSQRQCLYLPLHTLPLREGHACNYRRILHSGCSWGSNSQHPLTQCLEDTVCVCVCLST